MIQTQENKLINSICGDIENILIRERENVLHQCHLVFVSYVQVVIFYDSLIKSEAERDR